MFARSISEQVERSFPVLHLVLAGLFSIDSHTMLLLLQFWITQGFLDSGIITALKYECLALIRVRYCITTNINSVPRRLMAYN